MTETWRPPQTWDHLQQTAYTHWWAEKERGADQQADGDTPLPAQSRNPVHATDWANGDVADHFSPQAIGSVPKGTVIVGIIDTGIALGHRRFRTADGGTRFIASWQQNAQFGDQPYLPFGQELYAGRSEDTAGTGTINALMSQHSLDDLTGPLDEPAFNQAARLVAPDQPRGQRDLDRIEAHGTHVLDLAAGCDPLVAPDNPVLATRIIAVNLPQQELHGTSGNFLPLYGELAVRRILFLADALWAAQHGDAQGGYPVVINFSFGQQAGPKDGRAAWENTVHGLIDTRNATAATQLVMPVGNKNLARGSARQTLASGSQHRLEVPWRIQPADQTANFLELWLRTPDGPAPNPADITLQVTPPGRAPLTVPALSSPGQFSDLSDMARIYRPDTGTHDALQYIVCVAPTENASGHGPRAPAGPWQVSLSHTGDAPLDVALTVQTDQSGFFRPHTVRQSYLDHPAYVTHLEDGRLRDSFVDPETTHDCGDTGDCDPTETGPVSRKGSHNAMATWPSTGGSHLHVIGGYQQVEDRPANYGATTHDAPGRATPTALYPSDDGPAHFGLMAAGAREGSVVALQGTSMATALATRDIVRALSNPTPPAMNEAWTRGQATPRPHIGPEKQGSGLCPAPPFDRIPRRGRH